MESFKTFTPHPYQQYCINRIVESPTVGLFLDMGLGKTVITLMAIRCLKFDCWAVNRVLVVAPKKVAEATWQNEAATWEQTQGLRVVEVLGAEAHRRRVLATQADVYVINRENIPWLVQECGRAWPFDMVVLDESSSFKNPRSHRFRALKTVRPKIHRLVELTGKWSTLVHPRDIDETNQAASITNITQVFNEEQKFPEMDAYTISTLYSEWGKLNHTADATVLSVANVLSVFDDMMMNMDNARVPAAGRVLYVTNEVKKMLKNAEQVQRYIDVGKKNADIDRTVSRIDEVKIIGVPSTLMKSKYTFDKGYKVAADADQINMLLVHPSAVITPVSYSFATLDAPSAVTEGKYIYFEESDEDVFILNNKSDALQFNVTAHA